MDTEAEVAEYTPELVSEEQEEPRNVLMSGEGILFLSCHPAKVLDLLRSAVVLVVILLLSCQVEAEDWNLGGLLGQLTSRESPMWGILFCFPAPPRSARLLLRLGSDWY